MAYIRWNCRGLAQSDDELGGALSRASALTEELGDIVKRLDPQLASYEELGRSLRTLFESAEENVLRLRRAHIALEEAVAIYANAENLALRESEDLPTNIAERGLFFDDWFSEIVR
jgi:ABC-type transporter Mla subunit MlaD